MDLKMTMLCLIANIYAVMHVLVAKKILLTFMERKQNTCLGENYHSEIRLKEQQEQGKALVKCSLSLVLIS